MKHWGHSDPLYRKGHALLTEADLAKFYNAADFYLSTSLGEGWGLGITEAMACGCAAGVPMHTACGELHDRLEAMFTPKRRIVGLPLEPHGVVCDWDNSRVRRRVDVEGAAALIAGYYHSGQWRERPELPAVAEQWLSWDRVAAKMLRLMKRRTATPRYIRTTSRTAAGLGDVLAQLFCRGSYNVLRDLRPGEKAKVALITHNPFAKELFAWHPKRSQMEVVDCGYWHGAEADAAGRKKLGLPAPGALNRLPPQPTPETLSFIPRPRTSGAGGGAGDGFFTEGTGGDKRVKAGHCAGAGGGAAGAEHPRALAREIMRRLAPGFRLVITGRSYDRHGRSELRKWPQAEGEIIDVVDRLSVPGTCALVQASGLVTCHSALNLLAWHLRKPQLLLYPRSAWERHIRVPDQWAFGIGYPETVMRPSRTAPSGRRSRLWWTASRRC